MCENIIQNIKETTTLGEKGDRIVYDDEKKIIGKHKKVKNEDQIASKLGRLYTEEIPIKEDLFKIGRHKSISCSVCMKYKGTSFSSTAFHAVSNSFATASLDEIRNLNNIPSDWVQKDKIIYATKIDGLFIAEGFDHRDHIHYKTDHGYSAKLIDDTDIREKMSYDMHPRLSNAGLIKVAAPGYSRDQDGLHKRAGIRLETSSDFAMIKTVQNWQEGFILEDFELNRPEKDEYFKCSVYGYAQIGGIDNTYVENLYEICIEAGLSVNQIMEDIQNTFLMDQLAKVSGNLFVFKNRCIGLFDASTEKGFSHGPVIRKSDKKVLGWIIGAHKCDNRQIVLLASHPIVLWHFKNIK